MGGNEPSETERLVIHHEVDQKLGESSGEAPKSGMDYKFFSTALLGVFLAFVDDTFVFTIHGTIASDFGNSSMGSWLVTAYNLGFAVSLPLYGRLCDAYGYKYPITAAYSLFTIGCAMSGFAGSLWVAIFGRLLSGAGGSGMTDLVVVIVNDMVPPRTATKLRSYISIVMTVAVPVGAPLGGALTEWIGWRRAFLLQVPMSIICLATACLRLKAGKTKYDLSSWTNLNLPGVFLLGISAATFMAICQIAGDMTFELHTALAIVSTLFVAGVLLFLINERCWTRMPLISLELIKTNGIGAIYLVQLILFFSYGGFCSHITEFWIRTANYVNSIAAATILPIIFGNVLSAAVNSRIVQRTGKYKKLLLVNCAVAIISNMLIGMPWPNDPIVWEMICYLGLGIGVGGTLVCTFTALSVSVPKEMTATAMTNYYLCQQLGLVVGVSVTSAASQGLFERYLFHDIPGDDKSKLVAKILNHLRFAFTLSEADQSIIRNCFLQSFRIIPAISSGSLAVAFLLLLKLPERSLDA